MEEVGRGGGVTSGMVTSGMVARCFSLVCARGLRFCGEFCLVLFPDYLQLCMLAVLSSLVPRLPSVVHAGCSV